MSRVPVFLIARVFSKLISHPHPASHLDPTAIEFGMSIAAADDFQKTFKVKGGHAVRDLFLHSLAEQV